MLALRRRQGASRPAAARCAARRCDPPRARGLQGHAQPGAAHRRETRRVQGRACLPRRRCASAVKAKAYHRITHETAWTASCRPKARSSGRRRAGSDADQLANVDLISISRRCRARDRRRSRTHWRLHWVTRAPTSIAMRRPSSQPLSALLWSARLYAKSTLAADAGGLHRSIILALSERLRVPRPKASTTCMASREPTKRAGAPSARSLLVTDPARPDASDGAPPRQGFPRCGGVSRSIGRQPAARAGAAAQFQSWRHHLMGAADASGLVTSRYIQSLLLGASTRRACCKAAHRRVGCREPWRELRPKRAP